MSEYQNKCKFGNLQIWMFSKKSFTGMATCSISAAQNIQHLFGTQSASLCLGVVGVGDCRRIYIEKQILMNLKGG